MRKRQLVGSKRVGTTRAHHALGVNQSDALQGFFARQAFFGHSVGNQMSNARCRRPCPQEKHALFGELFALDAHGRVQTGNRHRGRTLNVVVKARDLVLPAFEQFKGVRVLEVLELDHHIGPAFASGFNEFLHQCVILFAVDSLLLQAKIERVVEVVFVVGAHIKRHRQHVLRVDAGASGVERELANGNTHAVDTQVTETQNALAVGHHDHLHIVRGHVLDEFAHATAIVD